MILISKCRKYNPKETDEAAMFIMTEFFFWQEGWKIGHKVLQIAYPYSSPEANKDKTSHLQSDYKISDA